MSGKQNILDALSKNGSEDTPVAMCYEGIFYKDHWQELTDLPWWYLFEHELEKQVSFRKQVVIDTKMNWYQLHPCPTRQERENTKTVVAEDETYVIHKNMKDGTEKKIEKPIKGGETTLEVEPEIDYTETQEMLSNIPECEPFDKEEFLKSGKADMAVMLKEQLGGFAAPVRYISSTFGKCVRMLGFENMMMFSALNPDDLSKVLMKYYENHTKNLIKEAAALGAEIVFIPETLTDMLPHDLYKDQVIPVLKQVVQTIHDYNMKAVLYYCGDPKGKLEFILQSGIDGLALEDGKKTFDNDIVEIAKQVDGRVCLFGNINPYTEIEIASEEEITNTIKRQLQAKSINKNRFVLSIGSPVTPDTHADKIVHYSKVGHGE